MQAVHAPTTRRAVLAGAIIASGAAVPSAAIGAASASPDAAIQIAADQVSRLTARVEAAAREHSRLEVMVNRRTGAPPELVAGGEGYGAWCAARTAYQARRKAAEEHFGFGLFNIAYDKLVGRQLDACDALAAVPATTLVGLAAKAHLAHHLGNEALAESVIADLVALVPQPVA